MLVSAHLASLATARSVHTATMPSVDDVIYHVGTFGYLYMTVIAE